ncbi:657_t:CDS:2, partial [Scutellospora calospora]
LTKSITKKRKNPSFTKLYFDKEINSKGEEVRICNIKNKNDKRCDQTYKNFGASTRNLIVYLRDIHNIINEEDTNEHISKKRKEAILKWMLITNQPISTITDLAYKEKISQFDSSFVMLREYKIKTMISKSYEYNCQNLKDLLKETAIASSKAKQEYLGITAIWITPDFKIKDIILDIKYATSPHMNWNLEEKITAIVTDNAIKKELVFVEILIARVRRYIQDVPTRWNSLYYAWDQLFYLKDAIIKLQADLCTNINRDEKKDSSKLKQIMLSEEEWELLDLLVDLLLPFEEAT